MRILTAFTHSLGGQDAYALAARMSDAFSWPMDMVSVIRGGTHGAITEGSDIAYQDVVLQQVIHWMDEVNHVRPTALPVSKHLRYNDSYPEGLIETAVELGSSVLVAGGGRHGLTGRVSLGSVGQTLLNASPVPVALAPRGARFDRETGIERITVMLGESGGWQPVLSTARAYSQACGAPLRLVTVATRDSLSDARILERAEKWLDDARLTVDGLEDERVVIARSEDMSSAVVSMKWKHELALLGSARLARKGLLFLGPTANKIMRNLPVPLVAVPSAPEGGEET